MYKIKSGYVRIASTLFAIVFALPISFGWFTGFTVWLSPFVMLNSLFLLKSMVWLNVLSWTVFLISFFHNRWFCRYLCPVGLGCDVFSKPGKRKGMRLVKKIPRIGRWLAIISLGAALTGIPLFILLDPLAIFNGFFAAFSKEASFAVYLSFSGLPLLLLVHFVLPGVWCSRLCPLGGLFDGLTELRKSGKAVVSGKNVPAGNAFGRRLFLATGTGLVAGILVPKLLPGQSGVAFRPPASLPDKLFNTLCVRCGNCIKACPTNIIVHHKGGKNLTAWMTPEVTFKENGYCLEDCNLCGTVCPSGSISPFTVQAKKKLFMGTVEIGLEKCLLTERTECDRCKAVCGYDAINIVPSEQALTMKPTVDKNRCVGCGACVAVCPPSVIKMISIK